MMGLVLLSLIALMLAGAVAAPGPATAAPASAGHVWAPGGQDVDLSSLPPQAGNVREHHVLSLWRVVRGTGQAEAAHLALTAVSGADRELLRDPQQLAHRTAGSRSPPLA
ncbi:hypothetical protein [[Actinomadura] parvosata]|uniref:hypothetical protein n=1 Tax=[Actinomadura] parvosata TaxID=1955412 RepID=UPI0012BD77D4|nr:hypothetical protein [Nonomuraea sp. ATCC 55076]